MMMLCGSTTTIIYSLLFWVNFASPLLPAVWGEEEAAVAAAEATCPAGQSANGQCLATSTATPPVVECGVYMAPSTLGEDTNMGIFTGMDLQTDDVIHWPEIAVPLLFREWGEHREGFEDGSLWERYIWEGEIMEIETYDDTDRHDTRAVFVPGVGCTVNGVADLNNIESTHGSVYDTAGLHRSKDPGVGAFTPYHSAKTVALLDMPAGSELFAAYGGEWIVDIPGAQITLAEPLNQAEHFLYETYFPFIQRLGEAVPDDVKQELYNWTREFPMYSQAFSNLPRVAWSQVEPKLVEKQQQQMMRRLQRASRHDEDEADTTAQWKEAEQDVVRRAFREKSMRTIDWLNQYGYCQDHIKPAHSTLPQAGYGAFATRFLPLGTIVGYSPLIHVGTDGRALWHIEYDEGRRHVYDLVINYSFGHRNSTLLLTPYGGMVNYINHNKTRANVKVQWPHRELIAHKPHWLQKDVYALKETVDKIGLSFEYVALRDIEEGEEVLMDYGQEWEDAWNEHVQQWSPVPGAESYIHTKDWPETHLRTSRELQVDPYPYNFVTMCKESYTLAADGNYEWIDPLRDNSHRIYCHVLERSEDDPPVYTVQMELGDDSTVVVRNVPDTGVFLYDRAFSYDWHLPNVFRHEIMIPDEIMPMSWMNGPPEKPW